MQNCRLEVIQELYDTAIAGHNGIHKTTALVARRFYWPNLQMLVEKYVQTCQICAQVKATNQQSAGLLQPLAIPEQRWAAITMDFITGLSPSGSEKFDAILTIVDHLTQRAHFWPTHTTATAEEIANLMLERYLPLHGIPKSIITDYDPKFINQF